MKRKGGRPPASIEREQARPPWNPWWARAVPFLAAALAISIYAPSFSFEFLNWDDTVYVVQNPWIREFSAANLLHIFTTPYFNNYLPIHLLSYLVDHRLWGLNPFGYHLSSALIHALIALVSVRVAERITGSRLIAVISALLFAVHPVQVEAVAWVSSRKELLSLLFVVLSLDFYLQFRDSRRLRFVPYLASVGFFLLALLSKMSAVVLPAFLILIDTVLPARGPRTKEKPTWRSRIWNKIPYLLIGLVLVIVNNQVQVKAQAPYAQDALSYATVKGHAAWNYLGLLAGVLRPTPIYDTPSLGASQLTIMVSLLGLVLLPAVAFAAHRYRHRVLLLGSAWIVATLLPALAFPLVTYMADRYLYAPSLGFCWIVAAGIVHIGGKIGPSGWSAGISSGLALVIVAGLVARTSVDLQIWRSPESLWSYAVTRCRDVRAYNNLAQVRLNQKRWDEAEKLLRVAAGAANATTHHNFAVLYYERNRFPEALEAIDKAIELRHADGWADERAAGLYYSRGAIYWQLGRTAEAIDSWKTAVRFDPSHSQARSWLERAQGTAHGEAGVR